MFNARFRLNGPSTFLRIIAVPSLGVCRSRKVVTLENRVSRFTAAPAELRRLCVAAKRASPLGLSFRRRGLKLSRISRQTVELAVVS